MKQSIKLFALLQDLAGTHEVVLEFDSAATVGEIREKLATQVPELRPLLASCAIAVNSDYAPDATVVPEDAEIAVIPPVSGG